MHKRAKGNIGEDVGCEFLKRRGFSIIARNYAQKWGELDIIAQKDNVVHFFEVKSVTRDFMADGNTVHRPEDNVHGLKVKHLRRIIEAYLTYTGRGLDAVFCFHILCVFMDMNTRRARVKWIENVIL